MVKKIKDDKRKPVNIRTNPENWDKLKIAALVQDKELIEVHDEAVEEYVKKCRIRLPPKEQKKE